MPDATPRPPCLTAQRCGRAIDLMDPDFRAIDLNDIAVSLARTMRFNGQTMRPLSVLEHSFVVMKLAPPRLRLAALLHDAHEALTGDITRPMMEALALEVAARSGAEAPDKAGAAVIAACNAIKARLDLAIAMQVLTLLPAYAGENAGNGLHRQAARVLAAEMTGHEVAATDQIAGVMEHRLFIAGGNEDEIANARAHYGDETPGASDLMATFIECVEGLVAMRFGQHRAMLAPANGD